MTRALSRSRAVNTARSTLAHVIQPCVQGESAMIRSLESLPERTLSLVGQMGDGMKHMVASGDRWLDAGAKIGALKAGSNIALKFVRRHPAATVATVAGAGLLWYLARRRAEQAENGDASDNGARRVEARRGGNGRRGSNAGGARKRTTRSRQATQE
jgi:hypothetical protein